MICRRATTFGEAMGMISALGGYAQAVVEPVGGPDRSFFILRDGAIVGIVPAFVMNDMACAHDGTSIIPFRVSERFERVVDEAICDWVGDVLHGGEAVSIKILADEALLKALSGRTEFAVGDNTRMYGYFDLRRQVDALWHSIRKSYKSLIRKGEQRFRRAVYGSASVGSEVVEFLHASPRTQFHYDPDRVRHHIEQISKGEAMLFAYWLDSTLAGVVGITTWRKFAARGDHFYELGAYDHTCGVPTHACLYDALSYYQRHRLGNRVFLLHGVPVERPESQAKLRSIDFFKLGYCSDTFIHPYKVVTLASA